MNFFEYSSLQPLDPLLVLAGAERGDDQRLRLAALEDGRAVRPRQDADLAGDGAELVEPAAVDPGAGQGDLLERSARAGRESAADTCSGVYFGSWPSGGA